MAPSDINPSTEASGLSRAIPLARLRTLANLHKLVIRVLVLHRSKANQQLALEFPPLWDSVGVLKTIIPLYDISFKVDGSDVHHASLWCLVIMKVPFRVRKSSRRVSIFPSREVHPHASSVDEDELGPPHQLRCPVGPCGSITGRTFEA
ncbi:hypothetical protein BHM03_00004287 [Ensete ventricosum]|nr:hypothetical protein BHM03_00004287 [Ensete ventricosum]